jgi:hypothetical protein
MVVPYSSDAPSILRVIPPFVLVTLGLNAMILPSANP